MKLKVNITILFLFFTALASQAQIISVHVSKLKSNTNGVIRVALFNSEAGFNREKPCFETTIDKTEIKNGALSFQLNQKPGMYAVSVLDDENNNHKLDFNRLGIPKEGFGLSNIKHKCFKKPKFSEISFQLEADKTKEVEIVMSYH